MAFGSNIRMYTVPVDADGRPWLGRRNQPRGRQVEVEVEVEQPAAPEWWGEYLKEEWNKILDQRPRDCRTNWRRSSAEWLRVERIASQSRFRPRSTVMPKHDVWGSA